MTESIDLTYTVKWQNRNCSGLFFGKYVGAFSGFLILSINCHQNTSGKDSEGILKRSDSRLPRPEQIRT
jgi:hypothetical protein